MKMTYIDEAAFMTPEMWEQLKKLPSSDRLRCKGASRDKNPDGTWGPWYSWCDDDGNPQYAAPTPESPD